MKRIPLKISGFHGQRFKSAGWLSLDASQGRGVEKCVRYSTNAAPEVLWEAVSTSTSEPRMRERT